MDLKPWLKLINRHSWKDEISKLLFKTKYFMITKQIIADFEPNRYRGKSLILKLNVIFNDL